jgi:hypothetical protein
MELHHRINDGIRLETSSVQNHHRKEGIQDIQPYEQDQDRKQSGAVAVHIATFDLIVFSPH